MGKTGKRKRVILSIVTAATGMITVGMIIASAILFHHIRTAPVQQAPAEVATEAPAEGTAAAGSPGEKPLLTEFGDFQCPHCARFAQDILPRLERDLIGPGTIRFEYRHYPFLGPESFAAAEASEYARDQRKFKEYHDTLLQLTAQGERFTPDNLAETAASLELDPAGFGQCLENGEGRSRVLADREYGSSLGVRGTPSLFLDGKPVEWRNYRDLRDQLRQRAKARTSRPGEL